MRATTLLVVILAGCSAPALPAPPSHATAPRAPTTPPPAVTFTQLQLGVTRLPAIAADGSIVVHAESDGDGGRGNPNLTLVSKDRSDRELVRIVVVTANDAEGQYDERGPSPALQARLDAANARLAALHARHDLRPLVRLTGEGSALAPDQVARASGEGLVLDVSAHRITLRARDAVVIDLALPSSWFVPDKQLCPTCDEVCRHPAYLGAAHADPAHALVLLTVAYAGTDLCPEPVSQHHVLTW